MSRSATRAIPGILALCTVALGMTATTAGAASRYLPPGHYVIDLKLSYTLTGGFSAPAGEPGINPDGSDTSFSIDQGSYLEGKSVSAAIPVTGTNSTLLCKDQLFLPALEYVNATGQECGVKVVFVRYTSTGSSQAAYALSEHWSGTLNTFTQNPGGTLAQSSAPYACTLTATDGQVSPEAATPTGPKQIGGKGGGAPATPAYNLPSTGLVVNFGPFLGTAALLATGPFDADVLEPYENVLVAPQCTVNGAPATSGQVSALGQGEGFLPFQSEPKQMPFPVLEKGLTSGHVGASSTQRQAYRSTAAGQQGAPLFTGSETDVMLQKLVSAHRSKLQHKKRKPGKKSGKK